MKLTDDQILTAVNWWESKLLRPKFDNGDSSGVASMLAIMLHSTNVDYAKVNAFGEKLLDKLIQYSSAGRAPSGLHVDYDPCHFMSPIADEVGIDGKCFPWKTDLYFHVNGAISVRCGHGASEEYILESP